MRKLIFLVFLLLSPNFISESAFADCTTKTCIDVYTKDGKIVIDGKRNGTTSKPRPKPTSKPTPRPTSKPTIKSTYTPRAVSTHKYTYKPRTSSPKPKVTTPSLADQVLQSLPTLQIARQPEGEALTRIPVIFYTDMPTYFNKSYQILGVDVSIHVKPQSLWNFGDGSILVTDKPGKPYPSKEISHSYSVPGSYQVMVATIWSGTFTVDGVTLPIKGAIRQISSVDVKVVGANTKFVGK